MSHEEIKKLLAAYADDGLEPKERKMVEAHIRECAQCQKDLQELSQLEEVLNKMELKKTPEETWEIYWKSVYNRLERKIGWIVFSIGVVVLLFFSAFQLFKDLIVNPHTPVILVIGLLTFILGGIILFVSILKEQLFCRKRERYKEIKK